MLTPRPHGLCLDPVDVALQMGHTDGGALVMRLYGHPDKKLARQRILDAANGWDHRRTPARPTTSGIARTETTTMTASHTRTPATFRGYVLDSRWPRNNCRRSAATIG